MQEKYATWVYSKEENADGTYDKIYKNAKAELGLSFKGGINYTYKDLKIITTLGLFTPYAWDKTEMKDANDKFIGYRDNNRRFGNFDVDWDTSISYQFLKCLNVTLSTSLKYYNGVKIADAEGRAALHRWILDTEYGYFGIPRPDISLFLDVPFAFTVNSLTQTRAGDDRSYLNGATDIHESSLSLQQMVREVYLEAAKSDKTLAVIDCGNADGEMDTPQGIFSKIEALIAPMLNER
jgi:hypothetical protein